ncbi:DF family (seleno)protein [Rhodococcus rhodochrous]|nr:thioredoxin family protein [Rhodococcus rhodochrous]
MRATRVTMDIELLYFDGCPNWEEARDRLAEALAATGNAGTPIRLRRIETPEAAERTAFPGSPTIRIDGTDPFAPTDGVGLSCRVYRTVTGLGGAPSVADLILALRQAEDR